MSKLVYIIIILGIVGNIAFLPQFSEKKISDYEVIKDSIYANKFKMIDTLEARANVNNLLEEHSFGFMIESNNYKEFSENKININMYLHSDSLFLLDNNNKSIISLFKDIVVSNKYFSKNFDVKASIIFIPKDYMNDTIIYQETFKKK